MKKQIITLLCATALLSSCHIYKSYDRPQDIQTKGLYRDTVSVGDTLASDTANFGNLPWREVFTDPQLQSLIAQGLTDNTDLQTAILKVKESQAALMSARLAYAPSLALSPQGTLSSFDKSAATKTYSLPVTASWEIDLFGKLLNAKRGAQTALLQTKAYRQAVQTQIIAAIANTYYTLLMLDRQMDISEQTADIMKRNVETMRAMKEAAMTNSAAVSQSEAAYAQVLTSLPAIRQSIRETENALCMLLKQAPQSVKRSTLEEQKLPTEFSVGVPLQLLSNRPDVKAAEMSLAGTYYNANSARAAFYPQITISGSAGWVNSAGGMIINPGKLLASAIGSLTQPLFYRGANIARLKIAKAQQQEAKLAFEQTLLNAGSEVSNALSLYQTSAEKAISRKMQVESSQKSSEETKELFKLGASTSYLEVLSAEQSLLSARLSQVSDTFEEMQAVVTLYRALGGGRED
ncbi:MAG: TolC family protein [Bacteroides sp.]